jgi:hypothetical protein
VEYDELEKTALEIKHKLVGLLVDAGLLIRDHGACMGSYFKNYLNTIILNDVFSYTNTVETAVCQAKKQLYAGIAVVRGILLFYQ